MYQFIQDLLPYVVLFYVLESLVWVRRHQVVFAGTSGRGFTLKRAGLRLAGLLPGTEVIVAQERSVGLTSRGIVVLKDNLPYEPSLLMDEDTDCIGLDDLREITVEDKRIKSGRRVLLTTHSGVYARRIAGEIESLRVARGEKRSKRLRSLFAAALDLDALREHRATFGRFSRWLNGLSWALFAGLSLLLPATLTAGQGMSRPLLWLLVALLAIHASIITLSVMALRAVQLSPRSILVVILPMSFFPWAAVHATAILTRDLYARFDPWAIGAVLLDREEFVSYARRENNLIAAARSQSRDATRSEFWSLCAETLRDVVAREGHDVAALAAARRRDDAAAMGYCPECGVEFSESVSTCVDCRLPLIPYPDH
ncbi:MAG: hypothetical protein HYX75_01145 [Acidobacteria bacterium]|nr:hypothetical protein [Acidobacteriota bacterium]